MLWPSDRSASNVERGHAIPRPSPHACLWASVLLTQGLRSRQARRDDAVHRTLTTFGFSTESEYRALRFGDKQQTAITEYESARKIPVYYLLYNPAVIPWKAELPAGSADGLPQDNNVGCRVVPFRVLASGLPGKGERKYPSYASVAAATEAEGNPLPIGGWRIEDYVADRLVGCVEGYRTTKQNDEELSALFNRRSGPISAAFAITIVGPDGTVFDDDPQQTE